MIVLDPADSKDDDRPSFDSLAFPEKAATSTSYSRLPDYETSQAAQECIAASSATQSHPPTSSKRPRLTTKWRRALIWVASLYVIITLAVGIPIIIKKKRRDSFQFDHDSLLNMKQKWEDNEDKDSGTGATILKVLSESVCTNMPSTTAFLRTFNDTHNFSATGAFSVYSTSCEGGDQLSANFTVAINPDRRERDAVLSLNFATSSDKLRNQTTYCFIDSGHNRGLWLHLPMEIGSADWLNLEINLLLPFRNPGETLNLERLATNLPHFDQAISDLRSYNFNEFILEGYRSKVYAKSLLANRIQVKTSLAGITGNFIASQLLSLVTLGGPIRGNLTIGQSTTSKPVDISNLILNTGNSEIDVEITLLDSPESCATFIATVETFNAPIAANIITSRLPTNISQPTSLWLNVENNVGPSNITVDANLDLNYDIHSKLSQVRLLDADINPNITGRELQYLSNGPTKVLAYYGHSFYAPGSGKATVSSILGDIVVHIKSYP